MKSDGSFFRRGGISKDYFYSKEWNLFGEIPDSGI